MKIDIKLIKNFVSQYNRLQFEFGTEIAHLNGFDDDQLSYTDFIDNFVDKAVVADSSIDGNSNVSHKDIVTLEREMPKPHSKLLAFNKIYYEISKKFGFHIANEWIRMEWMGMLYMHDAPSSTFRSYCFAYDLKDLAERGLYFIEGQNPESAKHLTTFVDFVKEFVSFACNRTSGAVGLPNIVPYMFYFWKKDVDDDYLGVRTSHNEKYYACQNFQRFIYAVNQPYVRDGSQSAFTNTSVFDHEYFEALFGGALFPDGTCMIDFEEEIIEFQKWYMEVMAEIRSTNMFTFPVSTISLLRQDGKFVDEDFAKWAIEHNRKWSDSNLFVDSTVNSLSNCPLAPDTRIMYYSDYYKKYCIGNIKDVYYNMKKNKKEYITVLSNGKEVKCKINKFNLPIKYKITLVNGATISTTSNHLNKVYGKDYVQTKNLTENDYLPFGLHKYSGNNLTYEDGLIVGMFLGDGSYNNNNSVVFSLNEQKKKELIDFLYSHCPEKYGATITENDCESEISGEKSCKNVIVNSKYMRGLIEMFVEGDNALEKAISGKAFVQSVDFRKGIIDGLYKTDGGNSNRIYTSSLKLKETLISLMVTLGMAYTLSEDNRDGRLGDNTCYTIRYYTPEGRTKRKDVYILDDDYMWIKIKAIEEIGGINESYCLELLDENIEPIFTLANGIITHNCRLKSNIEDLGYFNSIGGSALKVGSIKVNTVNLARLALDTNSEEEYLEELKHRTFICLCALDAVRHIIQRNVEKGILPNFSYGLIDFEHLYNTIGFIGIYETMKKFGYIKLDEFGNTYYTEDASKFGEKIFKTMRTVADTFIDEFKCDYQVNTEQIPGESAAAKLMKKDKFFYPKAKVYDLPLYGNQFVPLGIKTTLQERIRIQALFDGYCNGGSILHANIDAPFDSFEKAWKMAEYIADQGVTYFAFNTKIQACKNNHAFYGKVCPVCCEPVDTEYTRIVGFYTKIKTWSNERSDEYKLRRWEEINKTAEQF